MPRLTSGFSQRPYGPVRTIGFSTTISAMQGSPGSAIGSCRSVARPDGEIAHAVAAGLVGVAALQADRVLVAGMLVLRQAVSRLQPQQRHAIGIARHVEADLVKLAQDTAPAHLGAEMGDQRRRRPLEAGTRRGRCHSRLDGDLVQPRHRPLQGGIV